MEGDPRKTYNRRLGSKPSLFPYISPGFPLHVQQPIKLPLDTGLLGAPGSSWEPLGALNYLNNWPVGSPWEPLGALGSPWEPLGAAPESLLPIQVYLRQANGISLREFRTHGTSLDVAWLPGAFLMRRLQALPWPMFDSLIFILKRDYKGTIGGYKGPYRGL